MGSWRSPATASVLRATFLSPSIADIAIAFTSTDEPIWTGLDVTGGWPAAILGLGYGCATASAVRSVARSTRHVLVHVLAVAHRLGARGRRGRAVDAPGAGPVAAGAPILFGFVVRARTPRPGPRFLRYRVTNVTTENGAVPSLEPAPARRRRIAPVQARQFVTLRATFPAPAGRSRSYSLSRTPDSRLPWISVMREPEGVLSRSARNGREHAFREEVRTLVRRLANARSHIRYAPPGAGHVAGRELDAAGRVTPAGLLEQGVALERGRVPALRPDCPSSQTSSTPARRRRRPRGDSERQLRRRRGDTPGPERDVVLDAEAR